MDMDQARHGIGGNHPPADMQLRTMGVGRATKRYGTIAQWCADTGMGRTTTYQALADGHLRAVKAGTRTLIDYEVGFAWLASLPPAKIRRAGAP
jgi:excisionase family DNA binding protein